MRVDEYAKCDATELAALIRCHEVTAEDVYAAARRAIEKVDASLNAVADGPWERPLDYAAGGAFTGVPFVMKDLGSHLRGVPTRCGTRLSGDGISFDHESDLVRRFREAGLAIAALTTAPEFGLNANTEAVVYGSTRNPWEMTRSAGGSSGGTAALVAAGAVPVGHAGDGGGSIRIPAAFNGLVGLKPSRGRVTDGPDRQEVLFGLAAEFAITRTIRDCAAMLDASAGGMPGDKFVIKEPMRPWLAEVGADPGDLRIALLTSPWSGRADDPEVTNAVETVGHGLEQLGHHVEYATPHFDWDAFVAAMVTIWSAACVESVETMSATSGIQPSPASLEHTTNAAYEYGREMPVIELAKAMGTVNEVSRQVGEFFTSWDLLVTPTVAMLPPKLGYLDANDPSLDFDGWIGRLFGVCPFTPVFNCTGTPAISLPLGRSGAGLPIGVQLAAPMCDEATLIRVGSQLEEAMPWHEFRPSVYAGDLYTTEKEALAIKASADESHG